MRKEGCFRRESGGLAAAHWRGGHPAWILKGSLRRRWRAAEESGRKLPAPRESGRSRESLRLRFPAQNKAKRKGYSKWQLQMLG